MGFEEDMKLLKDKMKQLETEYEQWFSGALPKPPVDTQKAVERLVKRYSRNPPQSLAERSVFQMHQSKYNSYSEMWARRVRLKEEGRLPSGHEERARRAAAAPSSATTGQDEFRKVFDSYIAARQKAGQATGKLTYDSFRQKLVQQADKFRKSGMNVDFGVSIKDGKVSVVARRKK